MKRIRPTAGDKKKRAQRPFSKNGGAGIFLCILLSAVILTEGVLYNAARIRGAEAELQRCMRQQISQILCGYKIPLLENYGLYGLGSSSIETQIFQTCFSECDSAAITANAFGPMTKDDLRRGIPDYMQIRMPAIASKEVLSRFSGVCAKIKESDLFKNAGGAKSSQWLGYLKNFLAQKDKWSGVIQSVVSAVETVDITGKVKEIEEFSKTFEKTLERSSTLLLEGDAGSSLSDNILTPDNLSRAMGYLDTYMDYDMPEIAENFMINQYAASFFDSKVLYIRDGDTKVPEANLLGVPFSDVHGANRADLEYLLTGISDETASFALAKLIISDTRTIINFGSYLTDKNKMSKAKEIAEILSAAIFTCSAGTVSIDPEILRFAILYLWAIGQGIIDLSNLIDGKKVPLFEHSALSDQEIIKDALMTDYRDYLGLYLLAVPVDWKLSRILTLLRKDCGEDIYTGVSLSVKYRGNTFVMEDSYDAYSI